jgi:hypothetical protein
MNTLLKIAAAAVVAGTFALPVSAETKTNDPFVSTQGAVIPPLFVVGGAAVAVLGVAAASGTN